MLGWDPVPLLIGIVANPVTTKFASRRIATKPIMARATRSVSQNGRRSPPRQRSIHQRRPRIGGMRTVVNLHDQERPPRAAVAQKARRDPVCKKCQKRENM